MTDDDHKNLNVARQSNRIRIPSDTNEDNQDDLIRKKQRDAQLCWNQYFVCAIICFAWILGTFGFSIAWVLLLAIIIHIIMWGSFSRLLEDCVLFEKRKVHKTKSLQTDESAEWLNFILNRWWLFSSTSIFIWLKANLEPLINEASLPMLESVTLKSCTFGDKTPFITSVRVCESKGDKTSFPSTMAEFFNRNGLSVSSRSNMVNSVKYRIAVQAEVGVICPEFQMTLKGKLSPGLEVDFVFENLTVIGQVQSTIQFSMDAAFPHISKATVSFMKKPEVNFDMKVSSYTSTEMMSILGIRDWFKSFIMDILTAAAVDPFELNINFSASDNPLPAKTPVSSFSEGILTVTIGRLLNSGMSATSGRKYEEERWCVLHLCDQKFKTMKSSIYSNWTEKNSFLVENLGENKMYIKIKHKKLIGTSTLAVFPISLIDCFPEGCLKYEGKLQKKGIYYAHLQMQYEPLKPVQIEPVKNVDEVDCHESGPSSKAGVIYICVHGADDLPKETKHLPNPYCVIFYNTKKIKTTHYVCQTCNPCWDSSKEFLVADISQTSVQIAVCNYNISKMAEAGLLGLATINLNSPITEYVMQPMSISMETSSDFSANGTNVPTLRVSVLFRPSLSMEQLGIGFGGTVQD